jgi:hypothetical protein
MVMEIDGKRVAQEGRLTFVKEDLCNQTMAAVCFGQERGAGHAVEPDRDRVIHKVRRNKIVGDHWAYLIVGMNDVRQATEVTVPCYEDLQDGTSVNGLDTSDMRIVADVRKEI